MFPVRVTVEVAHLLSGNVHPFYFARGVEDSLTSFRLTKSTRFAGGFFFPVTTSFTSVIVKPQSLLLRLGLFKAVFEAIERSKSIAWFGYGRFQNIGYNQR